MTGVATAPRIESWPSGTFLARLARTAPSKLIELGVLHSHPDAYPLLRQGEPGSVVFLILNGLVKITGRVENGTETLLAVRVPGDVIGEMAILDGSARCANAITCGPTSVCVIKGPIFLGYLQRHAAAGFALSRLLVDRLRWANQRRLEFTGYEADVCLARILLTLAADHGKPTAEGLDVGVLLARAELGSLIGVKVPTVRKALGDIERRGLIRRVHRHVVITDLSGLAAFAGLSITPRR